MELEEDVDLRLEILPDCDTVRFLGGVYGVPPKILLVIAAVELAGRVPVESGIELDKGDGST